MANRYELKCNETRPHYHSTVRVSEDTPENLNEPEHKT